MPGRGVSTTGVIGLRGRVADYLPILSWAPRYRREWWSGDAIARLTLWGLVVPGGMVGLLSSRVFVVYKSSRPHLATVGRIPCSPGAYSDLDRHPENTPVPGVLTLRVNGAFYYANALTVRDQVRALVEAAEPPPRALVLDLGAQDALDLTSAEVLIVMGRDLQARGLQVYLTDVLARALEFARSVGVLYVIPAKHVLPSLELAVQHIEGGR